jgi:hypothetical protein
MDLRRVPESKGPLVLVDFVLAFTELPVHSGPVVQVSLAKAALKRVATILALGAESPGQGADVRQVRWHASRTFTGVQSRATTTIVSARESHMSKKNDKWLGFKIALVAIALILTGAGFIVSGKASLDQPGRVLAGLGFLILFPAMIIHFVSVFQSSSNKRVGPNNEN